MEDDKELNFHAKTIIPEGCWDMKTSYPHIPLGSVTRVENFQYRGEDRSYLYKYFFSPLAEMIASWCPTWLAPNLITLFGFNLNVISHIALVYYQGFGMEGEIPEWVIVMTGVWYFIYILLDNVDGKQARRTNSSSVMGMLFDHGCDAYTSTIIMINLGKIFQVGNNPYALFAVMIVTVPFYFATLESYYIGGVFLPEVNAVTDGWIIYLLVCVFSAFVGYEWLISPVFLGLRLAQLGGVLFIPFAIIFATLNIYEIFYRSDRVRDYDFEEVCRAVWLVILIILTIFLNSILTPGDILQTPVPVLYLFGLLIIRPIIFMQLYLVTGQPLLLWRRTAFFTVVVLWIVTIVGGYYEFEYWHLLVMYITLIAINALAALHMIYFTLIELGNILDIDVFSIARQQQKHERATEV